MSADLLALDGIELSYAGGRVRPLRQLELRLAAGELVCVRGKSGSGKTSLLLVAGGLLRPQAGRVRWGEQDPYAGGSGARARLRATQLGVVFQSFHLLPYLDLQTNVSLAAGGAEASQVRAALERVGLSHRATHRPGALSAGERQRAACARALVGEPRLLLADEPTGNLDEENASAVLDALSEHKERGGAVVLVTHGAVPASADRVLELREGRLEAQAEGRA